MFFQAKTKTLIRLCGCADCYAGYWLIFCFNWMGDSTSEENVGLGATKPVFGVSDKARHKSVFLATLQRIARILKFRLKQILI